MSVLRCTEAFGFTDKKTGVLRAVRPGDLVDENDPLVKGRRQWFESVDETVARATDRTSLRRGRRARAAKSTAEAADPVGPTESDG